MSDNNQWGGTPGQQPQGNMGGGQQPPYGGFQPNPGFQPGSQYPGGYPPPNGMPQMPQGQVGPSPGFVGSIKLFFSQFATFEGRSRRSEFWYAMLFQFIVGFVVSMFQMPLVSNLISLVFFIPNLALQCRRLHDIGRSGHWIWTQVLAGVFGIVALLYLVVFVIVNIPDVREEYIKMGIDVTAFYDYAGLLNIPGLVIVVMVLAAIAIGIMFLVFNCTDSQKGTNEYGPSQKYPDTGAVPSNFR